MNGEWTKVKVKSKSKGKSKEWTGGVKLIASKAVSTFTALYCVSCPGMFDSDNKSRSDNKGRMVKMKNG